MSVNLPTVESPQRPALDSHQDSRFVQQVAVGTELAELSRFEVFSDLLAGKRVLYVGLAGWSISAPPNDLYLALDGVCSQLDGVDPHDDAAEATPARVRGQLYTSLHQVTDTYDVVLIPEVLENMGDARSFLADIDSIDFGAVIITAEDASQCRNARNDNATTGASVRVSQSEHNDKSTPHPLTSLIVKYTNWHIDGLYCFDDDLLLLLASRQHRPSTNVQSLLSGPPQVSLPGPDDAVAAARAAEYVQRAIRVGQPHRRRDLELRRPPSAAGSSLHICYLMPRTDVGGGARVILEHATRLVQEGCQVTVLSHFPEPSWHPFEAAFVQVPFGLELAEAIPLCDLIVAGYWDQVLAARSVGIAPVMHFEQGDVHLFEALTQNAESVVLGNMKAADGTITLSARNAEILRNRYHVKSAVIPNAVDPRVFHAPPGSDEPDISRPYMLVVGWDGNAFKGVDDAYQAWKQLQTDGRTLDFVWVTPRSPLIARGQVVVAPEQAELARLYQGATVYVHASHYESFPLPPLEAMACGAPVVGTRNAGFVGYGVDGDNCLLVDVADIDAMTAAVRRMLDDRRLLDRCRAGGLRTAASHSWPTITRQLLVSYQHLAGYQPPTLPDSSWQVDLNGITPVSADFEDRLRGRLASSSASSVSVPVRWPAFDGHSIVRWKTVASRGRGRGRTDRAFLLCDAPAAPTKLPYLSALGHFVDGRPEAALKAFVKARETARDPLDQAAFGRWISLCLLECGRDLEAFETATLGATANPDYSDYQYLAATIGALVGGGIEVARAFVTAALLGPGSRYPEWFDDCAGMLSRNNASAM